MPVIKTVIFYTDIWKIVKVLPDDQKIEILNAFITTAEGMEAVPPETEPALTLYNSLIERMYSDIDRYKAISDKRRQSANTRWKYANKKHRKRVNHDE